MKILAFVGLFAIRIVIVVAVLAWILGVFN